MNQADSFGPLPPGHVEVLRGRSRRAVRDSALALQARGIQHSVQVNGAGARVLVLAHDAPGASAELVDFAAEAATWGHPSPPPPPIRSKGVVAALSFGLLCVLFFPIGQKGAFGLNWWDEGLMSAAQVRTGEVWRAVTALTLHVDAQHLVGNLVFGSLFGILAAQSLGAGLAWFCTLAAGALGNFTESYLTSPTHTAVGASTAIFGTLGVMVTSEWARRGKARAPWVRRVAPLFGGGGALRVARRGRWLRAGRCPRPRHRLHGRSADRCRRQQVGPRRAPWVARPGGPRGRDVLDHRPRMDRRPLAHALTLLSAHGLTSLLALGFTPLLALGLTPLLALGFTPLLALGFTPLAGPRHREGNSELEPLPVAGAGRRGPPIPRAGAVEGEAR